jgi:hypothetical protein
MAIAIFLGMWLSRVSVFGTLGFLVGFVVAVSQAIGEPIPPPEVLVRSLLWLGMSIGYGCVVVIVLTLLFMPGPAIPPAGLPKPKGFFVPDAFTNPAHVHFALKVTLAGMFCYIFYMAVDWSGIYTALITCFFIPWPQESTGATLHKGVLRIGGCIIGGALALFTIVFLMPHMITIASLVVVVACASAIAGWVAAGSQRIAYAGLQIAFAFFFAIFQGHLVSEKGYAPDTDLDHVRDRFMGILLGLIVTGVVFAYIWPEHAIDRLRDTLRQALQQLARLLEIPRPETSIEEAKSKAHDLIAGISKSFDQARRHAELTRFEFEESPDRERTSLGNLERTLSRAEDVFDVASSLASDQAWTEWQQLPPEAKIAESDLRNVAAMRIERAATVNVTEDVGADLSTAFAAWNQTVQQSRPENNRSALVSRIAAEVQSVNQN